MIGIDFAAPMVDRAREAVAAAGLEDRDIELRVADMAASQLPDACADVVVSNCVINLCPDKDAVYGEAFRILKLDGRLAISDIMLTEDVDPQVRERFQETWAGCLGGVIPEGDYWQVVENHGFASPRVVARHVLTPEELKAMACCPGEEFTPPPSPEDRRLVEGRVASVKFTASKTASNPA